MTVFTTALQDYNSSLLHMLREGGLSGERAALLARRLKRVAPSTLPPVAVDLLTAAVNFGNIARSTGKGRPEYRDDQARGEGGRWVSGGGVSPGAARGRSPPPGARSIKPAVAGLGSGKPEVVRESSSTLRQVSEKVSTWWAGLDDDTKREALEFSVAIAILAGVALYIWMGAPGWPVPQEPERIPGIIDWIIRNMPSW